MSDREPRLLNWMSRAYPHYEGGALVFAGYVTVVLGVLVANLAWRAV